MSKGKSDKLNKICDSIDTIKEQLNIKKKIMDEIKRLKSQCNGAPQFSIDSSLPSLNINFAIYYFIKDLVALVSNLKVDEIRARILNWLVETIEPLQKRLQNIIKSNMKSCYTCKCQPTIGEWLYQNNPSNLKSGTGFNIKVEDIDERCILKINPNSEMGKIKYDDGFNRFLWDVIQQTPATLPWVNPNNGRTIAHFTFLENSPTSFTVGSANNPQTTNPEPNIINVKIDDYYHNKTLTDFTMEYLDSILPLFNIEQVFNSAIDGAVANVTKSLRDQNQLSDRCIEKEVEADAYIDQVLEFGLDDDETESVLDDSLFEFSEKRVINIKQTVENKKKGQLVFTDCCNKKTASVSPQTLTNISNELSTAVNNGEKVKILEKGMNDIVNQTTNNVDPIDAPKAGFEFLIRLLSNITKDIFKLTNSPKNKILTQLMEYLTTGETKGNLKSYYKASSCTWKDILKELLKKLIYEFLLPWLIKNLKPIIICVITKLIKEKIKNTQLSLTSLVPGFGLLPPEKQLEILETVSKISNGLKKATDFTSNFANKVNFGTVKDAIGLEGEGIGKFC